MYRIDQRATNSNGVPRISRFSSKPNPTKTKRHQASTPIQLSHTKPNSQAAETTSLLPPKRLSAE